MIRVLLGMIAMLGAVALAAEPRDWPPSGAVEKRMQELHAVIANPGSSKEERDNARAELARLLKSPAARNRVEKEPPRPPRAAIDPFPSVVKPIEGKLPSPPPPVHVEPLPAPPKPTINPQTGSVLVPSPGIAVDPRTGHVLQETPNGYVDPQTGRFVPK